MIEYGCDYNEVDKELNNILFYCRSHKAIFQYFLYIGVKITPNKENIVPKVPNKYKRIPKVFSRKIPVLVNSRLLNLAF